MSLPSSRPVDQTPRTTVQAALNGALGCQDHPAVPQSAAELARDAVACVRAGATSLHVHPRSAAGRTSGQAGGQPAGQESLDPDVVDGVCRALREAAAVPVGVTTGLWIEPDPGRRLALVRRWTEPDFASVNLSEPGAVELMEALVQNGIGVEAGVWSVRDAQRLVECGLATMLTRVLVEPVEVRAVDAVDLVTRIHEVLDGVPGCAPRLQHGDGEATWVLIRDAAQRGLATRVGLEDTTKLPDGTLAPHNAALVSAAIAAVATGPGDCLRTQRGRR